MSPFMYTKSRVLTNLTLYPYLIVTCEILLRLMNKYKVDLLSAKGLIIYFVFMIAVGLIYMVFNERVICKKEP